MISISNRKGTRSQEFGKLKLGDTFIFGSDYCIKTHTVGTNQCVGVVLLTGHVLLFKSESVVVPVNLELSEV